MVGTTAGRRIILENYMINLIIGYLKKVVRGGKKGGRELEIDEVVF